MCEWFQSISTPALKGKYPAKDLDSIMLANEYFEILSSFPEGISRVRFFEGRLNGQIEKNILYREFDLAQRFIRDNDKKAYPKYMYDNETVKIINEHKYAVILEKIIYGIGVKDKVSRNYIVNKIIEFDSNLDYQVVPHSLARNIVYDLRNITLANKFLQYYTENKNPDQIYQMFEDVYKDFNDKMLMRDAAVFQYILEYGNKIIDPSVRYSDFLAVNMRCYSDYHRNYRGSFLEAVNRMAKFIKKFDKYSEPIPYQKDILFINNRNISENVAEGYYYGYEFIFPKTAEEIIELGDKINPRIGAYHVEASCIKDYYFTFDSLEDDHSISLSEYFMDDDGKYFEKPLTIVFMRNKINDDLIFIEIRRSIIYQIATKDNRPLSEDEKRVIKDWTDMNYFAQITNYSYAPLTKDMLE